MSDENVGELRNEIDDGLKEAERKSSPSVESWNRRANRWANFSDNEIEYMRFVLAEVLGSGIESGRNLWEEVHAELGRRQKGSK